MTRDLWLFSQSPVTDPHRTVVQKENRKTGGIKETMPAAAFALS